MAEAALPVMRSDNSRPVEQHHLTKGLVRLTMACPEHCAFCNLPAEDQPQYEATLEELEQAVATVVAAGGSTLTISGGEPTLRREALLALVTQARARGLAFVELQTTGSRIDEGYAADLAAAGLSSAFVSLLSHRAAIHDELMGRAGAQAGCLRGIDALAQAGVEVILNPVVARPMQTLVDEYVSFVATRLPTVRSISLSVVQPHGRAAERPELLPDYAVLGEAVRRAHAIAEAGGIELVNPYCGLPLCVGWEDHVERCVEAAEALGGRGASEGEVLGIDNRGDKRHGEACRGCAWRTRCGGAWHAYWEARGGSGLQPPSPRLEPWHVGARQAADQVIVEAPEGLTDEVCAALRAASAPTIWLMVDALEPGDGERAVRAGCTDLLVCLPAESLQGPGEPAAELRRIDRQSAQRAPQRRLRVALWLGSAGSFAARYRALEMAHALGVDAVCFDAAPSDRWERFIAASRKTLPGLALALSPRGQR